MEEKTAKIKPGECHWCRIDAPEPGGYSVTTVTNGLKGFLPSPDPIEIGRSVPTTYVCMNGDRALFTFAFTMGTSARVQHSTASDEENAFSVWVDAHPKYLSLRRAIDQVMPPISSSSMMLKVNAERAREFFPSIEESQFTGCMKVYCESSFSRGALIFFRGRVVGAIYTKKPYRDPFPFEIGIKKMLGDLTAAGADADLEMYDLPMEVVLSMSSLFLGYLDKPKTKLDNLAYAEKMLEHFSTTKETACFNVIEEATEMPLAFCYIWNGEFKGTYILAEQIFNAEREFLLKLMEMRSDIKLQAHILPTALTTESVVFGYSLGAEQFAL